MIRTAAGSLKRAAKAVLPAPVISLGRRAQRYWYGYGWRLPAALPPLPDTASAQLALAHRAWLVAARSPANQVGIAYNSLTFEGFSLPGERPWEPRWAMLREAVSWSGARVLELGCNVGLLATFALHTGAAAALGVDNDAPLLEANHLLQQAYRVRYGTVRCSFDDARAWEDELAAFRPTIVTALSVLTWVRDQARFLRFLGRFDTVVFEGHDSAAAERRRLQDAGFPDVTTIGRSERGRIVLLARRA